MPSLGWDADPDATKYEVQFDTTSDFSSIPLYDVASLTSPVFKVPASLTAHVTYYWRARAVYGPSTPGLWSDAWSFEENGILWRTAVAELVGGPGTNPAVGSDGKVYVGSYYGLKVFDSDGSAAWSNSTPGEPLFDSSGNLYVSDYLLLYALDAFGATKWTWPQCSNYPPAVGAAGSLYFGTREGLSAVAADGSTLWSFASYYADAFTAPVVGRDGCIYFTNYDSICALNPDGTLKWSCDAKYYKGSLALGPDGTVYVATSADRGLVAIDPLSGARDWTVSLPSVSGSRPVTDSDGTIYIGSEGTLHAINPNGTEKWLFHAQGVSPEETDSVFRELSVSDDGMIYFAFNSPQATLMALDHRDGQVVWQTPLEGGGGVSSPVLSSQGVLYVVMSEDSYLYAIETTSHGLANSSWPMYRHDPQHTGRAGP